MALKVINHLAGLSQDFVISSLRWAVNEPFPQVSGHKWRFFKIGAPSGPAFHAKLSLLGRTSKNGA